MATFRVNNSTLLGGEVCAQWQANHAYSEGARCVCTTAYATTARRGYVYECTTAGTSHATTQPTWPTSGTVNDGTAVWTTRNPNDGSWDNASCILHYVLNHGVTIAAGDTVYVDDGHSESVLIGASAQYIIKGTTTKNNPIKIICVDKSSDTLSVGAVISDTQTSTSYTMQFQYYGYSYGVKYTSGSHIYLGTSDGAWTLETSSGNQVISLAASRFIGASGQYDNSFTIIGDIEFQAASARIQPYSPFLWLGGSIVAASGVTSLIVPSASAYSTPVIIRDVDLSSLGNNNILDINGSLYYNVMVERCKLPAAFTTITDTYVGYNICMVRLHHCSSDNATYDFYEESYTGTSRDETTIVRTGGASDGTTPLSMKMVSSANTKEQYIWLESPTINTWTTSAASQTITVELVHDSATALQNDEIWMEVEYPADNSSGLGARTSTRCAILGTPADIPDSSEDWTTTGLTNPNTRKITATIDPGKVGPVTARICLAKASTTVYVDPMITIT